MLRQNYPLVDGSSLEGNPRGRLPGTRNRATVEAREFANKVIDDGVYREALRRRMIAGTAGAMEALVWAYAKGRPVERVEQGAPGAFTDVTDDELKARLRQALALLG